MNISLFPLVAVPLVIAVMAVSAEIVDRARLRDEQRQKAASGPAN